MIINYQRKSFLLDQTGLQKKEMKLALGCLSRLVNNLVLRAMRREKMMFNSTCKEELWQR